MILFFCQQGTWKENADEEAQVSEELSPSGRESSSLVAKQQESQSPQDEQLTDQDILKSIEDIYFSSSDFDPSKYELLVSV